MKLDYKISIRRLPKITVTEHGKEKTVFLTESGETPLMQVFNAHNGQSLFVYGDGGRGKTATLYSFYVDYSLSRTPDKRACYFVPASRLQSEVNNEKKQAISTYIGDKYKLKEHEFDKKNSLILLDAVNEAEYGLVCAKSLLLEIRDLMGEGCQFIISGKTDIIPGAELVRRRAGAQDDFTGLEGFDVLYCKLCDLDNDQVIPVLQSVNAPIDTTEISQVLKNNQMLSMYAESVRKGVSFDGPLTSYTILRTYMEETIWLKYLEYISKGKLIAERELKRIRDDFDTIYKVFSELCKGISITKQRIDSELKKHDMQQTELNFFGFLQKVGDNYIWTDENWLCYFAAMVLSDGIKRVYVGDCDSFPMEVMKAVIPDIDSHLAYLINELAAEDSINYELNNSFIIQSIRFEIIAMAGEILISQNEELLKNAIFQAKKKFVRKQDIQSRYAVLMNIMYFLLKQEYSTRLLMPKSFKPPIVDSMFEDCSILINIDIPYGITRIEGSAFCNCENLISVALPNSVKSIGREAFAGCIRLVDITIPHSVVNIEEGAFSLGFAEIAVEDGNKRYHGNNNCIVETKTKTLVACNNCNIPSEGSIAKIDSYACSFISNVTNLSIPSSVKHICKYAFYICYGVKTAYFPKSIVIMEPGVFEDYCDDLTDIYCEADAMPNGWHSGWNFWCNAKVHWGVSREEYDKIVGSE